MATMSVTAQPIGLVPVTSLEVLSVSGLVTVGVDTHQMTHHGAVLDARGGMLGEREFPADAAGYQELFEWALGYGVVDSVGVESTGSYGAGLVRYLSRQGVRVVEVNRPLKRERALHGKSDVLDAVSAARQVQAGTATGVPKVTEGAVEAVRVLHLARRSAVEHRVALLSQIRDVATSAPEEIRCQLIALTSAQRVKVCLAMRPDMSRGGDSFHATKMSLRSLARQVRAMEEEIADLDAQLEPLVVGMAPNLMALPHVGVNVAAQLLITAGLNNDRFTSEAAFARLTGVAPIPASSGKSERYRLSRGGDRKANSALYLVVIGRLGRHAESRTYMERRTREGLSKKDIIRCLKRYVAREVFHALKKDLQTP